MIFSTGLGQTTPAAQTGTLLVPPANGFNNTGAVTVTIGGQSAPVDFVPSALPGFCFSGSTQTAVTVPSGVTGTAKVVMSAGSAASNSVNLAVQ